MNSQGEILIARAIIRYLNGDLGECHNLLNKAVFEDKNHCDKCGYPLIKAKKCVSKQKYKNVKLCTSCNEILEKVG